MTEDMLQEKEKSEEAHFKLGEELRFKATARRNRMIGLWAARLIGLGPSESEAYAKEVVIADLDEPGDADVVRRLMADLTAKGIDVTEEAVAEEMKRLFAAALAELAKDYPMPLAPDHERVGD
ncbi:MAG: DUF1476 domain-containing protein [Magnetospirillum sp. WYHS-4]